MSSVSLAETATEREEVYRLRYDVYVAEMNLYRGLADHTRKRLLDGDDATARHLIARMDDTVVGALRMHLGSDAPLPKQFRADYDLERFLRHVPESRLAVLTRFTVRADQRGGPVPLELMIAAYRTSLEHEIEVGFLDCVPHLIGLYEAMGFRRYKENVDDPWVGVLVPMVFVTRDGDHLLRVGSPLAPLSRRFDGQPAPGWLTEALGPSAVPAWATREEALRMLASTQVHADALEGLDEAEIGRLLERSQLLECAGGDHIVRRGTVSRSLYVMLRGEVEVRIGSVRVATLTAGQVFGEVNFFVGETRSADVVAGRDGAQVLHLNERNLRTLMLPRTRMAGAGSQLASSSLPGDASWKIPAVERGVVAQRAGSQTKMGMSRVVRTR